MDRKWMNRTVLALSIQMLFGMAYAAEQPVAPEKEKTANRQDVEAASPEQAITSETVSEQQDASMALQQQAGDATKETNLQEVFTSNERQYSLIKRVISLHIMMSTILITEIHS